METLINPANGINKTMEGANLDRSLWKVIAVGAAGALATGFFGFFLKAYLVEDRGGGFWPVGISLITFLIIFLLQTLFVKSRRISNLILLLESSAAILFFLPDFSLAVLSAWLFFLFFLWVADKSGKNLLENDLKFQFLHIDRKITYEAITGLAALISILYISTADINGNGISKKGLESILKPAEPLIQRLVLDNFSFQMSVYQLTESVIIRQAVQQLGISPASVPAELKNEAINKTLADLRERAAGYGMAFKNSDSITDIVYNYIKNQIAKLPEAFRFSIPFGFGLLVFFTIKGLQALIRWLVAAPAYLLYQILLAFGFAALTLESRNKEIIILK